MHQSPSQGFYRALLRVLILVLIFSPLAMPGRATRQDSPHQGNQARHNTRPIPAPRNPIPTIQLDQVAGYPGQSIGVHGNGVAGFSQVRLAWWVADSTETEKLVTVQANLAYAASLTVPADAPPGPARVCAAVAGGGPQSELAEFACTAFTITAPPPASLSGAIPLTAGLAPGAINADMLLTDSSGQVAARAAIAANGSFAFNAVPPGDYLLGPEGDLPVLVEPQGITLLPAANQNVVPVPAYNVLCAIAPAALVTDLLVSPGKAAGLTKPGTPKSVGTYLSLSALGPVTTLTFKALVQAGNGITIQRVEFWITRPDGFQAKIGQDSAAPYQVNYNASLLMPGQTLLTAQIILQGSTACTRSKDVNLLALDDPFNSPILRNKSVTWNSVLARYEFSADIPDLPGLIPAMYPDPAPSIPLIGKIENSFDVWQHFSGHLYLDRRIYLNLMQYTATAKVLNQAILNKTETWWSSEHQIGTIGGGAPPKMYFGPSIMLQFQKTYPVYSGPLWTFAGIVTVNASVKIAFNGSVILQGILEPWTPAASMRLMPNVSPGIALSMWLDLLLIIGKVGITGHTNLGFGLPLVVNTKEAGQVYFEDPCLSLHIWLEGWAEIYYYFDTAHWDLFDFDIVKESWGGCGLKAAAPAQAELRSLPAPALASDGGLHLALAYVEDTTPALPNATPQVMVRFWDVDSNGWGPATGVSASGAFVKDPALAFTGPAGETLVVWSQNSLTRQQGAALGQDVSAIFAHQEIYFAFFNGSDWTAPQRLTNDSHADGVPAIAGDAAGGATLAWVTDLDGNLATHGDVDIAATEWNGAGFDAVQYPGNPRGGDTALDAQVAVIRPASRSLTSVLAWTHDLDANLPTNADRSIMIARLANGTWTTETPPGLPTGLDSPALAGDASGLWLAFLARGKDEDGLTDTGPGNTGQLWSGQWDVPNGWSEFAPVLENGATVRAEAPRLLAVPGQNPGLLFRRFDEPGTPGEAGALALSQVAPGGMAGAPLYIKPGFAVNWMQAVTAFNGGQLVVASLNSTPPGHRSARPVPAVPLSVSRLPLAGTADTLETGVLLYQPDPALDPVLAFSPQHPLPGNTLTITATLRNLGQDAAIPDMVVSLYSGLPGSGSLVDEAVISESLEFNAVRRVVFHVPVDADSQPFYAELTPAGTDPNPSDNLAAGDPGQLPPPDWLSATPAPDGRSAILLSWMPPPVPGVTGYRILRAATPGGPYELVGESHATVFEDTPLERGVAYYYVVQAYDDAGLWSGYSAEAGSLVALVRLYLPALRR